MTDYDFVDRKGSPIALSRWLKLRKDPSYCRVRIDQLGAGRVLSTVWIGTASPSGHPYESVIFSDGETSHLAAVYEDEETALEGHARLLQEQRDAS